MLNPYRLIILILPIIIIFNCNPRHNYPKTIHSYDGPPLKKSELGEIYISLQEYYQLSAVDGKNTSQKLRLYLLPGKHTILVKSGRRCLEGSPYIGTTSWYIRNDVLMDVIIEAGHKYVFQSEDQEKAMPSVTGPFIKDKSNNTIVSHITESKYALYQFDEDRQQINIISDIIRADVADLHIHTEYLMGPWDTKAQHTKEIGLLTIDVPYEGLPLRFQEAINKKKWYSKGDIVEMAFSNRKRSKEKWPRWPVTLPFSGPVGYDIFIRTPNNSWYSFDFDRFVNTMK